MPQIKSQEKRVRTNNKRYHAARSERTVIRTSIKNVQTAVANNDKEAAVIALNRVYKLLDESVTSNLHHKNFANRHKARLSKLVDTIK